MATILTPRGDEITVDEEDYRPLNSYKWYLSSAGYAVRRETQNGKQITVTMQMHIMKTPKGMHTDHINGNKLDNRKFNLRVCTHRQNICNSKTRADNSSGYKGVSLDKRCKAKPWRAVIKNNHKSIWLGGFSTKEAAANAYREASIKYHGEYSSFNGVEL